MGFSTTLDYETRRRALFILKAFEHIAWERATTEISQQKEALYQLLRPLAVQAQFLFPNRTSLIVLAIVPGIPPPQSRKQEESPDNRKPAS
jgi:hypothetical protein